MRPPQQDSLDATSTACIVCHQSRPACTYGLVAGCGWLRHNTSVCPVAWRVVPAADVSCDVALVCTTHSASAQYGGVLERVGTMWCHFNQQSVVW
mgnify:CR=1 FL=1